MLEQTTLNADLVVLGVSVVCVAFEPTNAAHGADFVWHAKSSVQVVVCRIRWLMPMMLLGHHQGNELQGAAQHKAGC